MNAFTRQRSIDFLSALFAVVDGKQASKAVKQYRLAIFPEEEDDDINYVKKAEAYFGRLKDVSMTIIPSGEGGDMHVPINRSRG